VPPRRPGPPRITPTGAHPPRAEPATAARPATADELIADAERRAELAAAAERAELATAERPAELTTAAERPAELTTDLPTTTLPSRRSRRAADAPAATAKAGRNLPVAIGVGVILGAVALGALLTRKEAFVGLESLAIVVAAWEISVAFSAKKVVVPVIPLAVGSLGMLVSAYVAGEEGLLVSFTLTAFGMLLWRIIDGLDGAVRDVAASVFAAAYLPFLAGFALLMLAQSDGRYRVLTFLAVCVASDVGGFAVGSLAGRHRLAPTISPKKSWEGLCGSGLACLVVGGPMVMVLLGGTWMAGALLGLAIAITATLGDLAESLLKRDLGIKDMGSLLPGHGGVMDRLDSLLISAPIAYLLLTWMVPPT
jgi:phosphatidate cytidylyltransferase